ncbi:11675_t:CDS:2, partial [Racocetra fulgida]
TEATSKQNDISTSTTSTGNEIKDNHVDKKDHGKSTVTTEYTSSTSSNAVSSLPVSPTPNFYYANGYADPQTIAAGEYQAAMAAGYDPSDPNVFSAYGHYGMHPSYSQYYPADYGTGFPGTPPLQGQTSPSLAPQPLSPYFTATSPPIAYYPTSPQVGPTGIIHSPPMHPYLYSPQSPYGVLHTLSPTLSQSSSSAPNSPPPQYLPGPGVPSPKAGPLNGNGRGSVNRPPHYNYDRRNSGSNQIPTLPNFNNPTKTTNIYIRGLPPTTTDESLHKMCSINLWIIIVLNIFLFFKTTIKRYGAITSSKAIIDQKQGDCKGYGFVMYESEDQAKHAIEQLTRLGLQVSFAKDLASTNIYLSNLPLDMNEQVSIETHRDSALAIIQKFNGYQLPGANLPLQVRFADSLAQKKLKGQTAKRRMWRTREFPSLGGYLSIISSSQRIIPQVPVTPEHMLGMATPGSPPGHGAYLQYYSEGVQPPGAYPAGSISPPFGPQYVPRYYQPLYSGPILHHGMEGQIVATDTSAPNPPETLTNDVPLIVTSDPTEELSELVKTKLNVDGGENDSGAEGGDTKS